MRSGNEPVTARSPLRLRLGLGVWGLLWALGGTVAFALTGRTGWAIACGVLLLVVAADVVAVLRHVRQGAHYQPGPDVPPYEPCRTERRRRGGRDAP
ncbi:DUF6343 family protein [Streptomyces somaliensis]|uniref:Uncharacterized protein n=1 Tax=Streptomyces somaliensis (strain ATCC 33201 / DSM 40738 / JCM 12659 / KCTC 9044 / NCTC 11332 / NRRL B-12077 / IP 733) TaxID=1134445 RepID=A0AA44DD17_STRE0|nr:DUF6343 family protein [Streptomyces somaliensis]MCP9946230.1 DUF6343 family protein [Streptomyces somaliensis]MCP9960616.1 DUF6343 family protein [Streptomyces somaliensis]MCP9973393.1 DUF6343 family protein [Streptomyces somaliensis]MCQ0022287.1 DUF6343 family protein [Streptomyces somaliensis DSM 40738]NKY14249.1 hypothetical protein [Streptomyces somaliensis DSM 40738]